MKKITNPIHNFHIFVKTRLYHIKEKNIDKVSPKSWGGPQNISHHKNVKNHKTTYNLQIQYIPFSL